MIGYIQCKIPKLTNIRTDVIDEEHINVFEIDCEADTCDLN